MLKKIAGMDVKLTVHSAAQTFHIREAVTGKVLNVLQASCIKIVLYTKFSKVEFLDIEGENSGVATYNDTIGGDHTLRNSDIVHHGIVESYQLHAGDVLDASLYVLPDGTHVYEIFLNEESKKTKRDLGEEVTLYLI